MPSPYKPHLLLAHRYWQEIISKDDLVIDATCGNGRDTLFLATLLPKKVFALDIQGIAIKATKELLDLHHYQAALYQTSHACFPPEIAEQSIKLIVYNLGYLPGGDKTITTSTQTTLQSIESAKKLLTLNGMISITCYPGHPEGEKEEKCIADYLEELNPRQWSCCHHRWLNRKKSPSLIIISRLK